MEYQDLKSGIRNHLNSAAEDFFMVGYFLRQISENTLFTEDGYKNIWEFAKGEYGLSTSSASRFMAIKKKQEEPKSFFGLPKTVRPEGSLLTTPGCGDGKYDCFSCARPCGIRQEERYCRDAPLGNPFFCTQMSEEKRLDIEAGLFSKECQFLNIENAETREGDHEPTPCCQNCENKTCFSRCDVAKKKDEDERKKEQAELQKRQKEAEGKKPDMTQEEIESLYGWLGIKPEDKITGTWLKDQHGRSYHGGGYGGAYFNCTPHGVKTDRSKEMTWGEAAKALKEVQEKKKGLAELAEKNAVAQKELREALKEKELKRKEEKAAARKAEREAARQTAAEPEDPNIIDADFREVEDEPKDDPAQEAAEARDERQEETITQEPEPDPEEYGRLDVDLLLDKYRRDLKAYHEADCPPNMIKTQRILVDALALLLERIDQGGAED